MDYKESIEWLYSFKQYGSKLGLDRISFLLDKLNNPQDNIKTIHVTGTNGKGSVSKFIASILNKAGYSVGIYISPHLERFSERIIINNDEISKENIVILTEKIKPIIDDMIKNDNSPTFFEIITAMAFQFFFDSSVDFAVIEVGLGGRFDATNVIIPLVSIITNISLEHTKQLGENIKSIAFEKAGIIKKNVPVVTAVIDEARDVIEKVALDNNSKVVYLDNRNWKRISKSSENQVFHILGLLNEYIVETSMLGNYQGENIALAINAIEILQINGVYLTDIDIIKGISDGFNPGRMEIVSTEPKILLDGAHNPAGMEVLTNTLKNDIKYKKLILIIGILEDKDVNKMLSKIVPVSDIIIATKSNNPRACKPIFLEEMIKKIDKSKKIVIKSSIPDAIIYAKKISNKNDLICISGSLYTIGEARSYFNKLTKNLIKN